MHTIAWTGHRPQHIQGVEQANLYHALNLLGVGARKDIRFVTGGALGTDTWAAEYALDQGIPLSIVLPFRPHIMTKPWQEPDRERLMTHISMADDVLIIHDHDSYAPWAYQRRNEEMVNRAETVFALWSGKPGGTANCIKYALAQNKPVWNLWPLDNKLHRVR